MGCEFVGVWVSKELASFLWRCIRWYCFLCHYFLCLYFLCLYFLWLYFLWLYFLWLTPSRWRWYTAAIS